MYNFYCQNHLKDPAITFCRLLHYIESIVRIVKRVFPVLIGSRNLLLGSSPLSGEFVGGRQGTTEGTGRQRKLLPGVIAWVDDGPGEDPGPPSQGLRCSPARGELSSDCQV